MSLRGLIGMAMENRRRWLALLVMAAGMLVEPGPEGVADGATARPNVLWFVVDDMSADFSCYGGRRVATPHVDRLAREGTLFEHAFTTAPVWASYCVCRRKPSASRDQISRPTASNT